MHHGLTRAALFVAGVGASHAAVRIADDRGGRIGTYITKFQRLRSSGQSVIIDGLCASACTMILAALPRDKICVTPQATLGFHAAYDFGVNGRTITDFTANDALFDVSDEGTAVDRGARRADASQALPARQAIAGDVPTVRLEVSTVCGSNSRSSLRRVGVRHRRSPSLLEVEQTSSGHQKSNRGFCPFRVSGGLARHRPIGSSPRALPPFGSLLGHHGRRNKIDLRPQLFQALTHFAGGFGSIEGHHHDGIFGNFSHAYDGTFGECRSLLQGIFVDIKRQLAFEHDFKPQARSIDSEDANLPLAAEAANEVRQ